ncbi:MAG TPA: hypothetical protein VJT83_05480 [Chitinophagaceae bacterium]|nr:hypothetical protein [Chitinophagaceae bacterium]
MATQKSTKAETLNPNTGRKMNIDAHKYDLMSSTIKKVLKSAKPLTFTEIVDGVIEEFKKSKVKFDGVVPWYAITVKNDLHSRGEIEVFTEKGKKLHRLPIKNPKSKTKN